MRTLVAMLFASLAAAFCTFSFSQNIADNIVAMSRFSTPEAAATLHASVYLGTNILGLLAGYGLGWLLAWPLRRKPPAP